MAGEFGPTNSQVAIRLRELESREDQCRQYIQHAQEREHEINVLRERIEREARLESEAQRVIELIEKECGPDTAWDLGKITNDKWFGQPYGRGYTVILNLPNSDRAIFEKRDTLTNAAERAIARAKERIAALSGKES